jgi:hypothetical protein
MLTFVDRGEVGRLTFFGFEGGRLGGAFVNRSIVSSRCYSVIGRMMRHSEVSAYAVWMTGPETCLVVQEPLVRPPNLLLLR